MQLVITVGPERLSIQPKLHPQDYDTLKKRCTYTVHNFEYTTQYKLYGWDGRKTVIRKDQTMPAGCVHLAHSALTNMGHEVTIEYACNYAPQGTLGVHGLELIQFQEDAVKKAIRYRRGIIQAPVRAGKTAIMGAIINRIDHYPVWIITNGIDLVVQTRKAIADFTQKPVGVFSEGKFEEGNIVVASYQALGRALKHPNKVTQTTQKLNDRNARILEHLATAKVVLFDECHHALAPVNNLIFKAINSAGYVIGLSGTPKPDTVTRIELAAAVGDIIFQVRIKTLINHGRLAQPIIVVYELPYSWYESGVISKQPFADVYEANIVQNNYRNTFIADVAKELNRRGKTVFIMINRLAHGPILRALIPGAMFISGEITGEARAGLYKVLNDKEIKCIIGTVGKEGMNLPSLDAVINAEGLESSVATIQKMRSLTAAEGKTYGLVIDFFDRGKYIRKHSKARVKLYKDLGDAIIRTKKIKSTYFGSVANE
jgi:superfamily II DNA or RNA helicase